MNQLGDWSVGRGPLYLQLSRAIARSIERGQIAHGSRLPSERTLARALSISRGTATSTYQELVDDGFIERRAGSGTFVIAPDRIALPEQREGSSLVARLVDRSARPTEVIDMSISVLHDARALPPIGLTTADLIEAVPDTGYSPWGLRGLRTLVAEQLAAEGLPTTAEQIVITTGAQQAISIAAACWVRSGDVVVVDDPTYPGAVSAFTAAGARLVGVQLDRGGVRLDALRDAIAEAPSLVYLQSTLHSPTGTVMTEDRRRRVAEFLTDARIPLVEDLALSGLVWSKAPPPIAAFAPDHPIAVVGSLSKQLWGGLRLGFVRAPEPVALRFARVKATHDLGSPVASQLLAERLLRSPAWPARALARNQELMHGCHTLTALLGERLASWRWIEPAGGLSLWVRLPSASARPFAEVALRHGVAVATADPLSVTNRHPDRIRLCFGLPDSALELGVERLAASWANHIS